MSREGKGTLVERLGQEAGAVTAEFALALPAVTMVLVLALGVIGAQTDRLALIGLAASGSRALARGEPMATVWQLAKEVGAGISVRASFGAELVCVGASRQVGLPILPKIELTERQCARKLGL